MTYDGVQICGFSIKGYVDVVSTHVEILVVERLVDVADELRHMSYELWEFKLKLLAGFVDHDGRSNAKMLFRSTKLHPP